MTSAPCVRNISVVEDNDQFRSALVDWLCRQGFKATGFIDGHDFLEKLHQTNCDLILSDVNMPAMDGPQLLQTLRQMAMNTPVIMMSASRNRTLSDTCMDLGALAFLSKPFEPEKLLAEIAQAFAPCRSNAPSRLNR